MTAKKFLQDKYPEMRGDKWNSHEVIDDNWVVKMMEDYHKYKTSEKAKKANLKL